MKVHGDYMNYADLIKKLRNKLILTQTELDRLLSVSFSSINTLKIIC